MAKHDASLSADDRAFFNQLAEVIFSNPFSFERAQLEQAFPSHGPPARDDHHYSAVIPALEQRLQSLAGRGIGVVHAVVEADRAALEHAYLFQLYHRYVEHFDALIQAQLRLGSEVAPVPFAPALIADLRARGIGADKANRYVALFFQLRRAYYFIARSLVGAVPCMRALRHALWNGVFTRDVRIYADYLWDRMEDFSTLLLGETGTGKGSAAAAIGRSGLIPFDAKTGRFAQSFTETFTATNLSQFPESLIESELFGHRKGAFTGAVDHHKGLFERCSPHGGLFLDEIGDVSVPVQIKLLNVLQERTFLPVGSHKSLRFSGRIIAATNRPIDALRAQGQFRDDFYYRLCTHVIEMPTLRARLRESRAELPLLVDLLVQRLTGRPAAELAEHVVARIDASVPEDYAWPGNVRELEQAIRRILLGGQYAVRNCEQRAESTWVTAAADGDLSAQALLAQYCQSLYAQLGSYEAVARRAGLDRRTVKRYLAQEHPK
jgi:hypothetical protein